MGRMPSSAGFHSKSRLRFVLFWVLPVFALVVDARRSKPLQSQGRPERRPGFFGNAERLPPTPNPMQDDCVTTAGMQKIVSEMTPEKGNAMEEAFSKASLNFTSELFRSVYEAGSMQASPTNLIFSPYSVWQAIVLTYVISSGDAKKEIEARLGFSVLGKGNVYRLFKEPRLDGLLNDGERRVSSTPQQHQSNVMIDSANRIYISDQLLRGGSLNPNTKFLLSEEIRLAKFASNPEAELRGINDWVSEVTRGKIPRVLTSDDVNWSTRMVLANAAYFKGNWETAFDKSETKDECFFLDSAREEAILVPTMKLENARIRIAHIESLKSHVVFLPYDTSSAAESKGEGHDTTEDDFSVNSRQSTDGEVAMILLVPDTVDDWGVDDVMKLLTAENLDLVWRHGVYGPLDKLKLFTMPKFKMETSFDLSQILKKVGLAAMFHPKAEFKCLSPEMPPMGLTSAKHKAVIEVNEKGTEAAAATYGFVSLSAAPPERIEQFKIDRPFIFGVLQMQPPAPLFLGVLKNPLESK